MSTLSVGAGQAYSTIALAVAAAKDGDTVLVQAGTYTNDFFTIAHKITLQSVGGLAVLNATASPPNGKAIVTVGVDVTIDGFGFTGAAVSDANGAGIRYEGGNMVVRNSVFWNNQDGILAGADPAGTILIQNSEFSHNGAGDGYSHNIYVNAVASLTIEGSYFHDSVVGHEIKSRALSTTIVNNRIQDQNGNGSYSIDLPDGGVSLVQGNVIEKGPNTENYTSIHFGGEGTPYANSSLTVSGNTLINDNPNGVLLLNQTSVPVAITGNQIYGYGADAVKGPATQSGNVTLTVEPTIDTTSKAPTVLPASQIVTPPDGSAGTAVVSFGQAGAVVASGHVLTVGKGGMFGSLQSALAASVDGDTIDVAAGTYTNDFGVVNHKVIIEGVGGVAKFTMANDLSQNAGLLVVNTDATIKNLEFTGTSTYGGRAAGVTVLGGNVTVVNSSIHGNEVGIYAASNAATTLSVYNSSISGNGNVNRGTNNVTIGAIESLTVKGSFIGDAVSGHEISDLAFNTDFENNQVTDGATSTASFMLDLGQGGNALIKNNVFVKGQNAQTGLLIHVGGEGKTYSNSNVEIDNNILASQLQNDGHPYTYFVVGDNGSTLAPISANNNTFVGGSAGSQDLQNASGTGNVDATVASLPKLATWTAGPAPAKFVTPAAGPNKLTLTLSEDMGDVHEQFYVTVDGKAVGGGTVTASHAAGATQTFVATGNWGGGAHQIGIVDVNPQTSQGGGANALYVQSVTLDKSSIKVPQTLNGYNVTDTLTLAGQAAATATVKGVVQKSVSHAATLATAAAEPSVPGFDAAYYLATYKDVANAGVDPLQHYMTTGWQEGRNPSGWFDTTYYELHNPDVAAAKLNPLVHYDQNGWHEGRDPSNFFSIIAYNAANPGASTSGVDPLAAFLASGAAPVDPEQSPYPGPESSLFDPAYYLAHNQDVVAAGLDPLQHYESSGWKEGRNPSATFNTNAYLQHYADVKSANMDPLGHYANFGVHEGRTEFNV